MSNHNKMKGLLKGLRYISQMFENEKEAEMQIGYPTDVKHVAHIGLDGQSMSDLKAPTTFSSAPLSLGGEASEESSKNAKCSTVRDLPDMPKATRRHASTGSTAETPMKGKPEKPKQSKKSLNVSKSKDSSQSHEGDSPIKRPDIPKKSRRKKSKESMEGSSRSSRSSRRADGPKSDVSESESIPRADDLSQTSRVHSSDGGDNKEYRRIS